jgi:two-component system sensor histidine kinase UhpB
MTGRLAQSEAHNQRLSKQLATIQEEERAEIARDLHDEVGPCLFAIGVDAAAIQCCAQAIGHDAILDHVRSLREGVSHIQRQVKSMLSRLRSGTLADLGLLQAVDTLTSFWSGRHPGLAITFACTGAELGFGEAVDSAIYRIIQESLINAIRHGNPRTVTITLGPLSDGTVTLTVCDDGTGLTKSVATRGMGLRGMAERVSALGGEFAVENRPEGKGVAVTVRIPLPHKLEAAAAP